MPTATHRLEIRVEPHWLNRVRLRARQLGLATTSFVRMAVASYLEDCRAFDDDNAAQPARTSVELDQPLAADCLPSQAEPAVRSTVSPLPTDLPEASTEADPAACS